MEIKYYKRQGPGVHAMYYRVLSDGYYNFWHPSHFSWLEAINTQWHNFGNTAAEISELEILVVLGPKALIKRDWMLEVEDEDSEI